MNADYRDIIPSEYLTMLNNLNLLDKFYKAIVDQSITPSDLKRRISNSKNFADFMRRSFAWIETKEGFKWWFNKIFEKKFPEAPIPTNSVFINRNVYTSMILEEYVKSYKSNS